MLFCVLRRHNATRLTAPGQKDDSRARATVVKFSFPTHPAPANSSGRDGDTEEGEREGERDEEEREREGESARRVRTCTSGYCYCGGFGEDPVTHSQSGWFDPESFHLPSPEFANSPRGRRAIARETDIMK